MKSPSLATVFALAAGPWLANADKLKCAGPSLDHWPEKAAEALDTMIEANKNNGSYAVFDMDNTSYQFDLEESLLPFLENRGILTRDTMDPTLKLIPLKDSANHTESLYSYYNRLCEVDDLICYPWVAQIFSGFPLRDLKRWVDEMLERNETVPATYFDEEGEIVQTDITPPQIFRGQVELYNRLMNNGIAVYVITAASEELVRMVASDPKYGYNVPPENVIGVTLLMKNGTSGELTVSRKQIAEGEYSQEANLDAVMTPYLWTPATWMHGKWAAILAYIDEWKLPVLAAGDTPDSDGPMIFHGVDVARSGVHLWVNRKDDYFQDIKTMRRKYAKQQRHEGRPVTADKNWVVVKPEDIL